jgi:hypothetical protein
MVIDPTDLPGAPARSCKRSVVLLDRVWSPAPILVLDAAILTTDRNIAGTGVATWSTPNLMRGLTRIHETRS